MSNQMKRELEEFRALILRLESDGTNIKDIVDKLVDHQKDIMAKLADMDKILQTIPGAIESHNNYALAEIPDQTRRMVYDSLQRQLDRYSDQLASAGLDKFSHKIESYLGKFKILSEDFDSIKKDAAEISIFKMSNFFTTIILSIIFTFIGGVAGSYALHQYFPTKLSRFYDVKGQVQHLEPHSSTLYIYNAKEETIERIIKQELDKQQKAADK